MCGIFHPDAAGLAARAGSTSSPRRFASSLAVCCAYSILALRGVDAQIRILAPDDLVRAFADTQGRIEGSTSTFGAPYYGDRVLGRLVYGESRTNDTHCRKEDYEIDPPETVHHGERKEVRLINVVLVRRGKCSFVRKVAVAEEKGAHAVVIVDREDSRLSASDIREQIIGDDGYGVAVNIPSILVSKVDGNRLIESVRNNGEVVVELAWNVPANALVTLDLWMSSGSKESMRFLKQFTEKRRALNDAVKFVPHYHVYSMPQANDYNDLCSDNTAQYCAEDPDGSGPVTGRDVLDEDVRQLCIHELTRTTSPSFLQGLRDMNAEAFLLGSFIEYAAKYWDYIERFQTACPVDAPPGTPEEDMFGLQCSEKLMRSVGIDVAAVLACSVQTKVIKLKFQKENTAWSSRALRINGWRYKGTMDADLVTRAICAGFVTEPPACKDLVEPRNPFANRKTGAAIGIGTFVLALAVVFLLVIGALLLYKRSLTKNIHRALREEVMLEVQAQMDTYKQLS